MNNDDERKRNLVEMLKSELNLVETPIETEKYIRAKELELAERQKQMRENLNKNLDEIDLDALDYAVIEEVIEELPESFFADMGLEKAVFGVEGLGLMGVRKENPEDFKKFMRKLSERELSVNFGDVVKPKEKRQPRKNLPIEALLESYRNGDDDVSCDLRYRFHTQSYECQLEIIKALLKGDDCDRKWACQIMLNELWDEALAPDVELVWESTRASECARIVALRCPLVYVLTHQDELGDDDYLSLCLRLARDKDFVVEKYMLTRREYCFVMAYNHIHLDDAEADSLLFGHILDFLDARYKPKKYSSEWNRIFVVEDHFLDNYDYLQSQVLNYKPSLAFLPNMVFCVRMLTMTGNISTVMKFLLWNKRLQMCIPSFLSEKYSQMVVIRQISENFKDYQDWSWEQLMKLAIETFPVDKSIMTSVFRLSYEMEEWYDDYYMYSWF